jgi:anti-sigma factor (TIGR02949 family)
MDCRAATDLVHRVIDREVGQATAAEVDRHVAACPGCRQLYGGQRALQAAIRHNATRHTAPAGLAARIGAAIDATPARRKTPPWRQLAFAASILLAMGLSSGTTWFLARDGRDDARPLAEEVVASHVRSLMADHLTDVASSDRHTVKPWFNGRIDVAPPVNDFTAQGFQLIGGRLDYLDRRPVAALVYRRSQHVINLFIWPAGGGAPIQAPASLNGYNIRQWTDGTMRFWAVSDVNATDLATFEQIVRAQN